MAIDESRDLALRAERSLLTGLCAAPADRAAAERAVHAAYATAGRGAPKTIIWLGSPESGARAIGLIRTGTDDDSEVAAELRRQGVRPGEIVLGRSLRPVVRTRPWARARAAALADRGSVGFARHWAASARRPWQLLVEQIATPLRRRLDARFEAEPGRAAAASREALLDAMFGQHDTAWIGAFDGHDPAIEALADVAAASGWWWAFEEVAILTERPLAVHRDNLGRLHRGDGPALSYPDGSGVHAWRGMPIPAEVAGRLATVTVADIHAEKNAEIRRVMLEHFGFERYLRESGAARAHTDETGTLWRIAAA